MLIPLTLLAWRPNYHTGTQSLRTKPILLTERPLSKLANTDPAVFGSVDQSFEIDGQQMTVQKFVEADVGMTFPKTEVTERLYAANGPWPAEWPFTPECFGRQDETDDSDFYSLPRLGYHIDEGAVRALTDYYKENIAPGSALLDICSSWVSHYPATFPETMSRISGTGMNALELEANEQLSDYVPKNLNIDPTIPFDDATFDVVTCVVSVDYLISPLKVFREAHRVLKPGGKFILSQSNRCFPSKAIAMWLGQSDLQHCLVIAAYFHYSAGWSGPARIFDISPEGPRTNDPLYIVEATKGDPKPLDASRWLKK